MANINHYLTTTEKRKRRVRAKLHGTSKRPRLTVNKSNKHIYLQVIDDDKGVTLASASDAKIRKAIKKGSELTKTASAVKATDELLSAMKKAKVKSVVFDRGQYKYHGRVKAVAEKIRESGIKV